MLGILSLVGLFFKLLTCFHAKIGCAALWINEKLNSRISRSRTHDQLESEINK